MKKVLLFLLLMIIAISSTTYAQQKFRSGIFLHHSTGGCIWGTGQGSTSVPEEITAYNTLHGYTGDDACSMNETGWPVNPWNNEWYRWHSIFDGNDATADISSYIQNNKIIMIKSCYPSSAMTGLGSSDDLNYPTRKTLWNYMHHWRSMINQMKNYPNNFFVIWTNAPLVAAATNDNAADLSHQFCYWAKNVLALGLDTEFGEFPDNVFIFDYFHLTAGTDNKLKPNYAASSSDSHPNGTCTDALAPVLVQQVFDAAIAYEISLQSLDPPQLQLPANHADGIASMTDLEWSEVENASSYLVQVSKFPTFSQMELNEQVSSNSYSDFEVEESQKYYWRVRAQNSAINSDWSQTFDFTGKNPELPGKVTLVSPEDNAEDVVTEPLFTWDAVDGAEGYLIEWYSDEELKSYFYSNVSSTNEFDAKGNNTFFYYQSFYWRVRANNISGAGPWSDVFKFTTETDYPYRPVLLTPEDKAIDVDVSATLTWDKAEFASSYIIQISELQNFSKIIYTTELEELSLDLTQAELEASTTYFWRVRGKNKKGDGSWSIVYSFTVADKNLASPTLTYPENLATDVELPVMLEWTEVDEAAEYEVAYGMDLMTLGAINATVYQNQYQPSLKNFETYYWKVRAKNDNKTGPWSEVFEFETEKFIPPAPTNLTPADKATNVPADTEFGWVYQNLCDTYRIEIYKKGETEPFHTEEFVYDCTIGSRPISKQLEFETEYEWFVVATYLDVEGEKSKTQTFTTGSYTSVNEEADHSALLIKPNPVSGNAILSINIPLGNYSIKVFDVAGNLISNRSELISSTNYEIEMNSLFDLAKLASGTYLIRIENRSKSYQCKFVK